MKKSEIEGLKEKIRETLTKRDWVKQHDQNLIHVKHATETDPESVTYQIKFEKLGIQIFAAKPELREIRYTSCYYKDVVFFDNGTVKIGSVIL